MGRYCSQVAGPLNSIIQSYTCSPSALPYDKLEEFLIQAKAVDDLVKAMDLVEIT